jgi:hypothetical protein
VVGVRLFAAEGCCALDDDGLRSISIGSSSTGRLLCSPDTPAPLDRCSAFWPLRAGPPLGEGLVAGITVAVAMLDWGNGPGKVLGLIHGLTARERAPM